MPIFELVVIVQKLEREALKQALKRTAGYIFEADGVIRKIDNLGFRELPDSLGSKRRKYIFGNYFVFNFNAGPEQPQKVLKKLRLDSDIVKATNFRLATSPLSQYTKLLEKPECELWVDMLPPPSRPVVQELQEIGKRKARRYKVLNEDDTDFMLF